MPSSVSLDKPLILCAPEPRTLDLIFHPEKLQALRERFNLVEVEADALAALPDEILAQTRYIIGQPPVDEPTLARLQQLRCIFNVESNLIDNMPYERLFERGIHVVTTGAVFAYPVAELGLALALNLLRDIVDADLAFRQGTERWGGDGNHNARLLSDCTIGIVGFGDLGKALRQLLSGFRSSVLVHDPWLPASLLAEYDVQPTGLENLFAHCDVIFVVAAVTSDNQKFIDASLFNRMKPGSAFILLSRADVVDFDALSNAVRSGQIVAATDVFPVEPVEQDDPVRALSGMLRSAHRAGALDSAFKEMGDRVIDDLNLLEHGLPPMRCKRAERETVGRMRSKPVTTN